MDGFKDNKAKKKLQPNEGPLEPIFLVPIKEDRNGCYDNICANIDRGMPGHPLEKDIQQQEAREYTEQENDYKYYQSFHYPESSICKHNEDNYASEVLRSEFGTRTKQNIKYNPQEYYPSNGTHEPDNRFPPADEDRHALPTNASATTDHTPELSHHADNDRNKRSLHYPESSIMKHNEDDYASEVLRSEFGARTKQNRRCPYTDWVPPDPSKGPLEPQYLAHISENRSSCYDNMCASVDRGVTGNPLEIEVRLQEAREAAEQEEDDQEYELMLHSDPSKGPLEPRYRATVSENRNSCYDNMCVSVDRGVPGNPLEIEVQRQEAREAAEQEEDDQEYELMLHFDPSKGPLEPWYRVFVRGDRNGCYDNMCASVDRGVPGNPLEREVRLREAREAAEQEEDDRVYRSHHYPESSIMEHNEDDFASEVLRSEFGRRPEEGELMQLDEPDDDFSFSSDSSVERRIVRPPASPNTSPRSLKPFTSSYDPRIFYPAAPKRNSPPKLVHNAIKDPVKLKVSLKEIGLDGLDDMIPVRTVQNLRRERMNRERMKQFSKSTKVSVIKPTNQNQTSFSKSMPRAQFRAALNSNQELSSTLNSSTKQAQFIDYSSDDSYSEHQFELSDIEESPPPSLNEIKSDKNEEEIDDKQFTLNVKKDKKVKIEEPDIKQDAPRSPRRKKEAKAKSTYDPSIFYTPLSLTSSSSNCEPARRLKGVNNSSKYPIKLNVSLKDIGLEGLDEVPSEKSKRQEKTRHKSRPRNY